jgi:quinoprotein glucose dehydrogenase
MLRFGLRYAPPAVLITVASALVLPQAAGQSANRPQEPQIANASSEGRDAIGGFRVPSGLKVELFAAEPLLANPVAFFVDPRGRAWVCETFRQKRGIEDNRDHGHWLDDDLAAQTVPDRVAYIRKHLGDKATEYTQHDDRIRVVVDKDGDGTADEATVFADGFNAIEDGTGAGVLVRGKDVFYTNIPHLWRLRDEEGDSRADRRDQLHSGYGVRFAFRGHDMHGLILGPDGRLYFSIGDRGLNVVTKEGKRIENPNCGAVLRCERDGSRLELFATGLRNPQELAFDDFGNLFTGDNNSDSGDRARWVYVVEGGDSGWRMEYQYLPDRGPFNREKIWHPQTEGQPAYIVPPIANLGDGPSGLAYYPGTGLPDHFRNRFFLCDFRGTPVNSGVRTFRVKPKGATFELIDEEQTLWSVLATDVDFGPDGAIYVLDWVDGWDGEGKGRIYRYFSPELIASPQVQEVKRLLSEGFSQRPPEELIKLLSHADRRVRQEAQFALAEQHQVSFMAKVATDGDSLLARLHGIWGLWQMGRTGTLGQGEIRLANLLDDAEPEVRAQTAKVVGELKLTGAFDGLVKLLKDDSSRVRYFAAVALGRLGRREAVAPLLAMLEANADQDPVLRHGGAMGLAGSARGEELARAAQHPSAAARMGLLLAMRRLKSEQIAMFLDDSEPRLVVEAACAIHDLPIESLLPKLAAVISRRSLDDALLRRVLNAHFRLGQAENAAAVARYASQTDAPEAMRLEALAMLRTWDKPSPKDRVLNFWRPLGPRDGNIAAAALRGSLTGLFSGSAKVSADAVKIAAELGIKEVGPELQKRFGDASQPERQRADALLGLAMLNDPALDDAVESGLADASPYVRAAARRALLERRPADALTELEAAAMSGEIIERQSALAVLGGTRGSQSTAILNKAMDQLLAGQFPHHSRLDLLAAAAQRPSGELAAKIEGYQSRQLKEHPLAALGDCLEGGDAERGRQIYERTELSCVRCHKIGGTGGEVGPDLSKIGAEKKRDYLLQSLIDPNKAIAKGFETAVIRDFDGQILTGIVKSEDESRVELITAEGKPVLIRKEDIEARKEGKSAMPEGLTKRLSKFELRDLVEFLNSNR